MEKTLVFTATYNEAENIESLIRQLFEQAPEVDVLVIDDGSPDGTGGILDRIVATYPRLRVIHRAGKLGLGSAHIAAFGYALEHGYQQLVTLDADFSHNPRYLPQLLALLKDHDFVIGSRYLNGGSSEAGIIRTAISKAANHLVRLFLGIKLRETTTSYRGFRRGLLEKLHPDAIRSMGYSFFLETTFRVCQVTRRVTEFPIKFEERKAGVSKINQKELLISLTMLGRLALENARNKLFRRKLPYAKQTHR